EARSKRRELGLDARHGLLERAALEAVRLALRRRQPLAGLLMLVAAAIRLVELGLLVRGLRLEGDGAVHVRRHAAPPAARDDLLATLGEALRIEHRMWPSAQLFGEKALHALPGVLRGGRVIGRTLVAEEAMVGRVVDDHLVSLLRIGERLPDRVDLARR